MKPVYKTLLYPLVPTVAILLIPLIAMQFSSEVRWTAFDFLVMGILIYGFGLLYVLIAQKLKTTTQRIIAAAIVGAALLLVWVQLAVGII